MFQILIRDGEYGYDESNYSLVVMTDHDIEARYRFMAETNSAFLSHKSYWKSLNNVFETYDNVEIPVCDDGNGHGKKLPSSIDLGRFKKYTPLVMMSLDDDHLVVDLGVDELVDPSMHIYMRGEVEIPHSGDGDGATEKYTIPSWTNRVRIPDLPVEENYNFFTITFRGSVRIVRH
jgi:hypothetical protein